MLKTLLPLRPVALYSPPPSSTDIHAQLQTPVGSDSDFERAITIFIAYAPENGAYLKKVLFLINALKQQLCRKNREWEGLNIITMPYDITMNLGMLTDTVASKDPFEPYQLIILLLSLEFVGAPFCYGEELEATFADPRVGNRLLCILLRSCLLEGYPFDMLPVSCYLPSYQRPISSWEENGTEDKAYSEVSRGLKKAIDFVRLR